MNAKDEELLGAATRALTGSWSPYSHFRVGAALRTTSGRIYTGANVENASYGLTICAERVAVFKAVTEGERAFEALAVACDGDDPVPPCGACLQVLREFAPALPVILGNTYGSVRWTSLEALLPSPFDASQLERKGGDGP